MTLLSWLLYSLYTITAARGNITCLFTTAATLMILCEEPGLPTFSQMIFVCQKFQNPSCTQAELGNRYPVLLWASHQSKYDSHLVDTYTLHNNTTYLFRRYLMKYSFLPYQYLIACVSLLLLSFHVSYYPLLFTIRARLFLCVPGPKTRDGEFSGLLISSKTLVVNRIAFMHCWRPSEDLAESISCKQSEAHTHIHGNGKSAFSMTVETLLPAATRMRCLRSFYPCIQSMLRHVVYKKAWPVQIHTLVFIFNHHEEEHSTCFDDIGL